jgi:uncharacterized membrane protein YdbT with pleckstrin-like domain
MPDTPAAKPRYQEHPRMFADEPGKFVLACVLIPVGVGIVWLFIWWLRVRTTLLTVGDERVLLTRGIFNKERLEIELQSIRTVRIDQTFVDRIFNCGVLNIYTSGDKPELIVHGMPDPERLRSALRA